MKFHLTFRLCASLAFAASSVFAQTTHLSNLSTRGQVATGGSIMISGFNIPAGTDRTVLIRAAGPTLANFAVTGVLANPKLEIYNSANVKIAENDDWGSTSTLSNTFASAGAFAFNANSLESALVLTLPAGGYTAQVSGVNTTNGVALVEVYDLSSGSNYLANLSTRGPVGTGSAVLVAGFNLAPSGTTRRLLIRAVGPTLSTFALTGLLADPKLELYNSAGTKLAENDDWATVSASAGSALSADSTTMVSAFTKAGAFALAQHLIQRRRPPHRPARRRLHRAGFRRRRHHRTRARRTLRCHQRRYRRRRYRPHDRDPARIALRRHRRQRDVYRRRLRLGPAHLPMV